MTRNEFILLNHLYNEAQGRKSSTSYIGLNHVLMDDEILDTLIEKGYVDSIYERITEKGIEALEPYRVKNAVILAAGAATRFIPLSLEQPKGLFEVKGEPLINRQIEQLHEAGIDDITVVLGYKKEMFFYLKEKYGVNFIFNATYNVKSNIESIYQAKEKLGNTYICSCDDYFIDNPFQTYEYESFYAGMQVNKKKNEMYVITDEDYRITELVERKANGYMLLGHSFWKQEFADKFIEIAEAERETKAYDSEFWEWLVKDFLKELPPFYFKEYVINSIHEFDYFEELRKFDNTYIQNTNSKIISNIISVFQCKEEDIVDFRKVNEGMTNTSFIFKYQDVDYIYRHPGDGTEDIISRANEKCSLELAKEWDIDPTYVYMNVEEGWKISKFVTSFREPEYTNFDDSKKILKVLRRLHSLPIEVEYGMKPWEDAEEMEQMLEKKNPGCFKSYLELKGKIGQLYYKTCGDGVEKCFCHGDTYKPNWMITPEDEVILIDWEYSGYSDPGIDVGYYIVDAMYEIEEGKAFIREYLGEEFDEKKEFHFLAYTAIIAYYWFVWAMYRESCGAVMGEALYNWYQMAGKYADELLK